LLVGGTVGPRRSAGDDVKAGIRAAHLVANLGDVVGVKVLSPLMSELIGKIPSQRAARRSGRGYPGQVAATQIGGRGRCFGVGSKATSLTAR
jgi:hypothetical protein